MFSHPDHKRLSPVGVEGWFINKSFLFKKHLYEDIFIRKYVSSFFFKWTKFFPYKILGSVQVSRTFGKVLIQSRFFYPQGIRLAVFGRRGRSLRSSGTQVVPHTLDVVVKPIGKYKKQATILIFFYQLEKMLGVQVFFIFRNISRSVWLHSKRTTGVLLKLYSYISGKLSNFRHMFKEAIIRNTLWFLIHLMKFRVPDGFLLASYFASVLPHVQKHTSFLLFVRGVLEVLNKVFHSRGVRIRLAGKLNGFARSQVKHIQVGCVPLQSVRLLYIEGTACALTVSGKIGIKVWISYC